MQALRDAEATLTQSTQGLASLAARAFQSLACTVLRVPEGGGAPAPEGCRGLISALFVLHIPAQTIVGLLIFRQPARASF